MNHIQYIDTLLESVNRPKVKKQPYKKPQSIKELERIAFDHHYRESSLPPQYRTKFHFRDDSANELTKSILKYLQVNGAFATRLNSTGIYRADLKKFVPNTQRKGLADILCTYKGISIQIEVKHGKDRMSSYQLQVKDDFEQSGGLFYVARDFTTFKQWFDESFLNKQF